MLPFLCENHPYTTVSFGLHGLIKKSKIGVCLKPYTPGSKDKDQQ